MYQENLALDVWRQRAYGFFPFRSLSFSVLLFSLFPSFPFCPSSLSFSLFPASLFLLPFLFLSFPLPRFPFPSFRSSFSFFPALLSSFFFCIFFALFFAYKKLFTIVRKTSGNCLNRSKGVFMNIRTITPASWSPQKTCCLYTEVSRKSVLRRWIRYKVPLFQYFLWRGLGI